MKRYAVLLDGGFVTKVLNGRNRQFPTANDVERECQRIHEHNHIKALDLLRVYFYDAPPATGKLINPIDKSSLDLGGTQHAASYKSLLDTLELRPNFALRMGVTAVHGWRFGDRATKAIVSNGKAIEPRDLVPDIEQKGVDLRIGLDIARLSLLKLVDVIVLVTGDSDLVPAMKFARREGVRIYLDHLGNNVRRELKAHADIVI